MKSSVFSSHLSMSLLIASFTLFLNQVAFAESSKKDSTTARLGNQVSATVTAPPVDPNLAGGNLLSKYEGKTTSCTTSYVGPHGGAVQYQEMTLKVMNGAPYVRKRFWCSGCSGPGASIVSDSGFVEGFSYHVSNDGQWYNPFTIKGDKAYLINRMTTNFRAGDTRGLTQGCTSDQWN